jgi:recombination associated protein RdgC
MWFKNILIYRFTKPFQLNPQQLEDQLNASPFEPCGAHETHRLGWSSPLGHHSEMKVHVTGDCWMICLKKQERILPSSVVNEQLQEKVLEIEEQQHRKVTRKEKTELKEHIAEVLLPQAFTRSNRIFAYLSPKDGYLIINTSSAKMADDFTSFLRTTIGSLPVRTLTVNQAPAAVMTQWIKQNSTLPTGLDAGLECELKSTAEEGGSVKCKGVDLGSEDVINHIVSGMQVTKLALTWRDSISFFLQEDLSIKRIKFGDLLREQLDDSNAEDAASEFDAGFAIMSLEFGKMIPEIIEAFGGEDRSAIVEE